MSNFDFGKQESSPQPNTTDEPALPRVARKANVLAMFFAPAFGLLFVTGLVFGGMLIFGVFNKKTTSTSSVDVQDTPITMQKSEDDGSPLSGEAAYQHLLMSTAFIVPTHDKNDIVSCGSGVLVHGQRRLVMTNEHVVKNINSATVYFPVYEKNGDLNVRPKYYIENKQSHGYTAKVVFRDAQKDLALLELDDLPSGVIAIKLAKKPAATGSMLYSVGASGIKLRDFSGTLWRLSTGQTRGRNEQRLTADGATTDAMFLESQKPVNPGDSGGPTVNEFGSLVGLVCMYEVTKRAVSLDIDLVEIERFFTRFAEEEIKNRINAKIEAETLARTRAIDAENRVRAQAKIDKAIAGLSDASASVRKESLRTLSILGSSVRHAIPKVLSLADDPDEGVRIAAEMTLEKIGPPGSDEIKAYYFVIDGKQSNARRLALKFFLTSDAPALNRSGITSVVKILDSPSDEEQLLAIQLLAKHGKESRSDAIRGMVVLSGSANEVVSQAAHKALESWAPFDANDIPAWELGLSSDSTKTRSIAVATLGKFAPNAKEAMNWLLPRLKDQEDSIIVESLLALERWKEDAKAAGKQIESLTNSKTELVVTTAIQTLCSITPADLLPATIDRLHFQETNSKAIAEARYRIVLLAKYPDDSTLLGALTPLLSGTPTVFRIEALRQLTALGTKAEPALRAIAGCLDENDKGIKLKALEALAAIGSASSQNAPRVLKLYSEEPSGEIGDRAIRALIEMGPDAIMSLAKAYRATVDEKLARLILFTIECYGPKAKSLVPIILESANDAKHPHGALHLAYLAQLERGKTEQPDAITRTLGKLGGDELAQKLLELTKGEVRNVLGQDTMFLISKLGGRPLWAILIFAAMDPTSVSDDLRSDVLKRLRAFESYDLSKTCRKEASAALTKWAPKK